MGLDMTLKRSVYIGNEFKKEEDKVRLQLPNSVDKGVSLIKTDRISTIIENVGYWRKANAIHKWFVDNVQDGDDDCDEYEVSIDDLKLLLSTVDRVLENHDLAETLLPPQSGFFFGSTELDDYYFQDLKSTKEIIENILKEDPEGHGYYYYQSSW